MKRVNRLDVAPEIEEEDCRKRKTESKASFGKLLLYYYS